MELRNKKGEIDEIVFILELKWKLLSWCQRVSASDDNLEESSSRNRAGKENLIKIQSFYCFSILPAACAILACP